MKKSAYSDKSYVSMEQHVCLVCGQPFDTGALLLDKRLRNNLEQHTVTGWGLCPEHQKLYEEGFVALVECDPERSESYKPEDVWRTGNIAHLRREVAKQIFDVEIGDHPLVFVEPGVLDKLRAMTEGA